MLPEHSSWTFGGRRPACTRPSGPSAGPSSRRIRGGVRRSGVPFTSVGPKDDPSLADNRATGEGGGRGFHGRHGREAPAPGAPAPGLELGRAFELGPPRAGEGGAPLQGAPPPRGARGEVGGEEEGVECAPGRAGAGRPAPRRAPMGWPSPPPGSAGLRPKASFSFSFSLCQSGATPL